MTSKVIWSDIFTGVIDVIKHHMPIYHSPCRRRYIGPLPSCYLKHRLHHTLLKEGEETNQMVDHILAIAIWFSSVTFGQKIWPKRLIFDQISALFEPECQYCGTTVPILKPVPILEPWDRFRLNRLQSLHQCYLVNNSACGQREVGNVGTFVCMHAGAIQELKN